MKITGLLASAFLASTSAFASDVITINPGSSTVIQPSPSATTVICSGATTILEKFCSCIDPGAPYLKRLNKTYIFSNAEKKDVYLGDFRTMELCNQAIANSPACAQ